MKNYEKANTITLSLMERAMTYHQWIYEKISPFLGGDILEVGCGIGNLTGFLLDHGKVLISDVNEKYLQVAGEKFRGHPNLKGSFRWDIREKLAENFSNSFDTIVCLNVLEHLEDDEGVLNNFFDSLPKGGRLILLVPALKGLYNRLDREIGHFRRYSKKELTRKITLSGFRILFLTYFNLFGIVGWFLNGTLLRRSLLPERQVRIFNRMTPFFIKLEKAIPIQLGQSLMVVGEKERKIGDETFYNHPGL